MCLLWLCCLCRRLLAVFLYWGYVYLIFVGKLDSILPNKTAVKEREIIEIIDTKLSFELAQQKSEAVFHGHNKSSRYKVEFVSNGQCVNYFVRKCKISIWLQIDL